MSEPYLNSLVYHRLYASALTIRTYDFLTSETMPRPWALSAWSLIPINHPQRPRSSFSHAFVLGRFVFRATLCLFVGRFSFQSASLVCGASDCAAQVRGLRQCADSMPRGTTDGRFLSSGRNIFVWRIANGDFMSRQFLFTQRNPFDAEDKQTKWYLLFWHREPLSSRY